MRGPTDGWGPTEHLLACIVDVLQIANWQRTGDKKIKRPEPFPRPGDRRTDRRTRLGPHETYVRLKQLERRAANRSP